MKALFLIRDLPYPATNGYKKRNYFLLKELAKRNIEITLFSEKNDENNTLSIEHLKSFCKEIRISKTQAHGKITSALLSLFSMLPFSVKARVSKKTKKEITKYIKENPQNLIICDAIHRALNIPLDGKTYKILYEHNIESTIIKRYADTEKNILKRLFALIEYLKFERLQKKIWKTFNYCIACSLLDKKLMEEKVKGINVCVVNNGVDSQYFSPDSYQIEKNTLVYTGQIGWHPNEDAIIYFIKNIYPLIKAKRPDVKFLIVGDNPSSRVSDLAKNDKSIKVTGFVEDVRAYMGKAEAFVVPLRIGAGTRLKILEALSMEKAIVTTSIGCEGLELENNKHLLIRDNSEEFAAAVLKILNHDNNYSGLGENGRKLIEEKYEWNVVFNSLNGVLSKIKL